MSDWDHQTEGLSKNTTTIFMYGLQMVYRFLLIVICCSNSISDVCNWSGLIKYMQCLNLGLLVCEDYHGLAKSFDYYMWKNCQITKQTWEKWVNLIIFWAAMWAGYQWEASQVPLDLTGIHSSAAPKHTHMYVVQLNAGFISQCKETHDKFILDERL